MREKREKRAKKAANERVDRNRRVRVKPIAVNKIRHALPERNHAADTNKRSSKHRRHPGGTLRWICGPAEPEKADGEAHCADDHGRETLLGDRFAVFDEGSCEVCSGAVGDDAGAEDDADDEGGEGELGHAERPSAALVVGDGVGFEEEVDDAVEEGHVCGDEGEDGLLDEHDKGADEVDCYDAFEGEFLGVGFGVVRAVAGFFAQGGGAVL